MKSLLIEMTELADKIEKVSSKMIMSDNKDEIFAGWELESLATMQRNISRDISSKILHGVIKLSLL